MSPVLSRLLLAIQTVAREGFDLVDLDRGVTEPFNTSTDTWQFTARNEILFTLTAKFDAAHTVVAVADGEQPFATVTVAHGDGPVTTISPDMEFLLAALRACSQEPF